MTPAEQLRDLLTSDILPRHRELWGDDREWPALLDFQRQLGGHGWTAPSWPIELGGLGLDVAHQVACETVFYELAAPPRVSVYGVNNVGPTIAAYGTPEQKQHLRAIVAVEELWCQGFSEPDAGSDLAGLRTRATRDGDQFVINGQKIWTSIGLTATHCMVLARTDPDAPKHRGISALLVPLDLPGVSRNAIKQINGGAEFAELFFDDVRVPSGALLGPLHDGWRVTMTTLGYERAGVISAAGRLALDTERTIRELAATNRLRGAHLDHGMSVLIDARLLRATGERALTAEASSGPGALSTIIKLGWSRLGARAAAFATDARGLSAVAGTDIETSVRLLDSCSFGIAGGATEVLKNVVAERILGLPKEPRP